MMAIGERRPLRIAVGVSKGEWTERFVAALRQRQKSRPELEWRIVDCLCDAWMASLSGCDALVWAPALMGPRFAGFIKERIWFMEDVLGLVVAPNYASAWSFESKVAQKDLFAFAKVPTPATHATFSRMDALECLEAQEPPYVFKEPHGASASNVRLVRDGKAARSVVRRQFAGEALDGRYRDVARQRRMRRWASPAWWTTRLLRWRFPERFGVVYWQEFVRENEADLRVTVIGGTDAIAFWRGNRPGDFRASGSGLLDFDRAVPEEVVQLCVRLSRRFGFQSMAYDLLDRDGEYVVVEMSYGYVDWPVQRATQRFRLRPDGHLQAHGDHEWPEELWVDWAIDAVDRARALEG